MPDGVPQRQRLRCLRPTAPRQRPRKQQAARCIAPLGVHTGQQAAPLRPASQKLAGRLSCIDERLELHSACRVSTPMPDLKDIRLLERPGWQLHPAPQGECRLQAAAQERPACLVGFSS